MSPNASISRKSGPERWKERNFPEAQSYVMLCGRSGLRNLHMVQHNEKAGIDNFSIKRVVLKEQQGDEARYLFNGY
jgi:hypothetical protein